MGEGPHAPALNNTNFSMLTWSTKLPVLVPTPTKSKSDWLLLNNQHPCPVDPVRAHQLPIAGKPSAFRTMSA